MPAGEREEHARIEIDRQLTAAGWRVVQPGSPISNELTALCEESGDSGRADYVLYLDGKACGLIEAKRSGHSLQGVQEQSAAYAAFRKWDDPTSCWQSPLPFRFEANGQQNNLPPPAELAAEIVESLESALEEFRGVEEALASPSES